MNRQRGILPVVVGGQRAVGDIDVVVVVVVERWQSFAQVDAVVDGPHGRVQLGQLGLEVDGDVEGVEADEQAADDARLVGAHDRLGLVRLGQKRALFAQQREVVREHFLHERQLRPRSYLAEGSAQLRAVAHQILDRAAQAAGRVAARRDQIEEFGERLLALAQTGERARECACDLLGFVCFVLTI